MGVQAERWFGVDGQRTEAVAMGGKIHLLSHGVSTFNAATGQLESDRNFGNSRCDASRATADKLLLAFGNMVDPGSGMARRSELIRGHCAAGSFPAYGMIYSSSNRCACSVSLRGQAALHGRESAPPVADAARLTAGVPFTPGADTGGWYTQNGDIRRSGASPTAIAADPVVRWSVTVAPVARVADSVIHLDWRTSSAWNGPVSAPVVAGEHLVVAIPWQHAVEARDARSGALTWRFVAGGRIDAAPTLWRGLVVFGCRDGSVYALHLKDGRLAWRFLAAPSRQQKVGYGQVESSWPVPAPVLVVGDVLVAVAGHHPEADGGMVAWGLEPATGRIRWRRNIERPRTWRPVAQPIDELHWVGGRASGGYSSNAILNTVLVSDGTMAWITGYAFEAATGRPSDQVRAEGRNQKPQVAPDAVGLRPAFSWDFGWHPPTLATMWDLFTGPGHGNGTGQFIQGDRRFSGYRIAFTGQDAVVVPNATWQHPHPLGLEGWGGGKDRRWAVADDKSVLPKAHRVAVAIAGREAISALRRRSAPTDETHGGEGAVEIRSLDDGSLRASLRLPAPVVENGLAVTDGLVYASLADGSVVCIGPAR